MSITQAISMDGQSWHNWQMRIRVGIPSNRLAHFSNSSSKDGSKLSSHPTSTSIFISPSSSIKDCDAGDDDCAPRSEVKLNMWLSLSANALARPIGWVAIRSCQMYGIWLSNYQMTRWYLSTAHDYGLECGWMSMIDECLRKFVSVLFFLSCPCSWSAGIKAIT